MSDQSSPLEANAYAITFRLLGDAGSARAAAQMAVAQLDRAGQDPRRHWLYDLTDLSVAAAVASPVAVRATSTSLGPVPGPHDPSEGMRAALRRRLVNATPDERVAGALVHLAGYPPDFVAEVLRTTPEATIAAAAVLAPPPGVDYRALGDPNLTGTEPTRPRRRARRRPHWTTIAALAIVAAAVVAATQVTGPRPTLGPPLEEGGMGVVVEAPAHLNGDPLTHATSD